ncbi:MAG: AlwI family type II restriction endonuclease [Melioribacteraceae bacterium]|nr:AlwI family type II restriction endonuclease [Melioribacteraceae bacterium]
MIFGLQLVDYRQFNTIVSKIVDFRIAQEQNKGNYKKFRAEYLENELRKIYRADIISGNTKTRETNDASTAKFLKTKASNMRDYSLYDNPLMLEWNTWRAMTMLDGGNIKANLKFDDFGNPMSTAQGNMADIVCDYDDFGLTVEATMQGGQRQYETEGEPVTRHLAKVKREINKPAYCLFIAPNINEACIAHFYALHKMNISYYGGTSTIVPLPLSVFIKMVEDSYKANYVPEPRHIQQFFEYSNELATKANNEVEWYNGIKEKALNWLIE